MSANVFWQPVERKCKQLHVMAPSQFSSSMTDAFGEAPWVLGKPSRKTLYGMLAMTENRRGDENPFMQMIAAIDKHETIKVWMEY